MKKVLTTSSFLVLGLFGLYYVFALFSVPPDVSTYETAPEKPPEIGIAVADTNSVTQMSYPVEDFTGDTAYKVIRVIDGDTVKIDYNGKATNVRLIGVDTPETVHPNKPVEAYGKEASNFTKNLLHGEFVYLRFDAEKTDKYDRLLAYLYRVPDGLFVNLEIVRQGYGHAYTRFPFKHMELFRYYGNRAREVGKGLYGLSQANSGGVISQTGVSSVASEAVDAAAQNDVYVTRTGTKYHREGCRSLSRSKIPLSLAEAKQKYSPCGRCSPPR